jgi:hypothetical protein
VSKIAYALENSDHKRQDCGRLCLQGGRVQFRVQSSMKLFRIIKDQVLGSDERTTGRPRAAGQNPTVLDTTGFKEW